MRRCLQALLTVAPMLLAGCLSNSYTVHSQELERLAATPPQARWESVKAVQRLTGDSNPPTDDSYLATRSGGSVGVVFIGGPPLPHHHHHHAGGGRIAPPAARHAASPRAGTGASSGNASGAVGALASGASKGNADPDSAILIAAAVVVGAAVATGAAVSEGARYDGWLAVHPEEPLHLDLRNGGSKAVPLSELSPEEAREAEYATVYEGEEGRFPRLGRAPLNRRGFTVTAAFHGSGLPQLDGTTGAALGGYFHFGGNISNLVSLGLAMNADSGVGTRDRALLAGIAPEVHLFALRYVGLYGGAGMAFRNLALDTGTRADRGWLFRGGLVGEVPLTTRLALQARFGVVRHALPGDVPFTYEGLFGFAVY